MLPALLLAIAGALPLVSAHIAMFHTSMYGFNWTDADSKQVGYDNRPVAPLQGFTFEQWWFHNHTKYPPNPGDFFELPAGQAATTELACDKSVTSFFASKKEDNGTDLQSGNDPCPSSDGSFPNGSMHTTGFNDLKGCALAIAYESDVTKIKPEDFTVFSVNQTCVWTRFTDFQVPARMPPCPEDGCHCAWFWIHADDSGGEQNYMNGFKCKVTNSTSNVALAKPKLPRRCGADPDYGKPDAAPGNCTYGAKQPFYWFQKEQNNMFEGQYAPPFYTDLYNFKDGAQDDIFVDSYPADLPAPNANSTFVPTPFLGPAPGASSSASLEPSAASSSSVQPVQSTRTADASTSSAQTSASAQSSAVTTSSATSSISPVSSLFTVSTLSQTAAASASSSISIPEPSLPLSTGSSSIPSFSQPSSASVAVSTSVVVSTVVVTVTAQPAPMSVGTASAAISSSSSILSSSSIPVSDSIGVSAGAVSSTPSSSAFMATQSAPSAPVSTDTQSVVAASTIVLGPIPSSAASGGSELAANTGGSTVVRYGGVLAADSTTAGTVCKREFGKHKVLRRRMAIPSQGPQLDPSSSSQEHMEGQVEDSSLLSRIPGLRRHRKLNNRSRLWSFF